jgi:hypothetical protein
MARKVKDKQLDSREARSRLKPRGKPYFRSIERGLHQGYRKLAGKSGTWWGRFYRGVGEYATESFGLADDMNDADGLQVFDYWQAQARIREWGAVKVKAAAGIAEPATVAQALERYEAELRARDGDAGNVSRIRKLLPKDLASERVCDLEPGDFEPWRAAVRDAGRKSSTANRLNAPFRAALNATADAEKIDNRTAWRIGLRTIPGATVSRNVIVPPPKVLALVAAAYQESEQFGLLAETATQSGARYGQLRRVLVGDLQSERGSPRIMMPRSKKGRGIKQTTHRPVPITTDLAARLRRAAGNRPANAPLLLKPSGEPWKKSDQQVPFFRAASRAGLDPQEVTMYALRHSSIVRQLLAGVPIRVVAVTHDSSVGQIERTYSEHILDHADELTRAALLDTTAATEPAANVLPMVR